MGLSQIPLFILLISEALNAVCQVPGTMRIQILKSQSRITLGPGVQEE